MRVLVTGASGFLGRWVTRALLAERHQVRVLVRRAARLGELITLGVEVSEGDILSRASVDRAARGVQSVVHCAGVVSLKPRDREDMFRTNVLGTENVLAVAARRDLRVLHTSTIATIGPARTPEVLDEARPPAALDFEYPYATSKRKSEELALSCAHAGQDVVVLNPGIMLGPDDVYFSSTEFVRRYLRSELGVHFSGGASFCDVRDVARAYPAALATGRAGERYVLAGLNRSYADVLAELRGLTDLQRSAGIPRAMAEFGATYSEMLASLWHHPLEELNLSVVRWGSLFNYCRCDKAARELGYVNRDFAQTLVDTVVDHLRRGAAQATTRKLQDLLTASPRAQRSGPVRSRHATKRRS